MDLDKNIERRRMSTVTCSYRGARLKWHIMQISFHTSRITSEANEISKINDVLLRTVRNITSQIEPDVFSNIMKPFRIIDN